MPREERLSDGGKARSLASMTSRPSGFPYNERGDDTSGVAEGSQQRMLLGLDPPALKRDS
jgi:hypothetical protein